MAAAAEQMRKLGHTTTIYMHPRFLEYAEKLTKKLPGDLKVVYLVNSGSEATELAFLMSRLYTGNNDIISLKNSYHGGTLTASTATGMSIFRHPIHRPGGHIHVEYHFQYIIKYIFVILYIFNTVSRIFSGWESRDGEKFMR